MDEIGVDEIVRLGAIAREKLNRADVEMGPAEPILFHKRHGLAVLVGARMKPKRRGKRAEPTPSTEDTRRRLADHYRGLRHASGSPEETAILKCSVLVLWAESGVPDEFIDELQTASAP